MIHRSNDLLKSSAVCCFYGGGYIRFTDERVRGILVTTKHINRKKFSEKMGGNRRHAKLHQLQKQRHANAGVYQPTTNPEDAQLIFAKNLAA